jgi:hypothetical protein
MKILLWAFKRFVEYFTRVRTFEMNGLWWSAAILAATYGIQATLTIGAFKAVIGDTEVLESGQWILGTVRLVSLVAFAACLVVGLWKALNGIIRESRKKVVCLESRGLLADNTAQLLQQLPRGWGYAHDQSTLELRQSDTGDVFDPAPLIEDIYRATANIRERCAGYDPRDLTVVYGGRSRVPFTFLLGLLIDDLGKINVMDWDRHDSSWRQLDEEDDGDRFTVCGLDTVADTSEVVLAVGVSYKPRQDLIQRTFSHPIVTMMLTAVSSENHWSQRKQNELAKQFLQTAKDLGAIGVRKIHLVLPAANSVVFRLGRAYDIHCLPQLAVYHFDSPRAENPYPWGVVMPVGDAEKEQAKVVRTGK